MGKSVRVLRGVVAALMPVSVAIVGAMAQGPGGGRVQPRPVLEALDTDHDGKLSAAEIAAAPKVLLTLDRNGDGQLTPDEITPQRPDNGAGADELVKQLMQFDKNGDGVLTADELPARMQGLFQRADTNHDGKLTVDEIRATVRRTGTPIGNATKPGQASGIMRLDAVLNALDTNHDGTISASEIAAASASLLTLDANHDGELTADEMKVRQQTPLERAEHMLDEWDTNKDGKLSRDEAPERMGDQFNKIDTNGDGFLDKDELTKYLATMSQGQRREGGGEGSKPVTEGSKPETKEKP